MFDLLLKLVIVLNTNMIDHKYRTGSFLLNIYKDKKNIKLKSNYIIDCISTESLVAVNEQNKLTIKKNSIMH